MDDQGNGYNKYSRTLYTSADGQFADGNVSIGVTNMQYVLSLGSLDTRYITPEARLAISAQTIIEKAAGSTGVYLNLGNIGGANGDDFAPATYPGADTVAGTADDIQNELYTSDGFLKSIMFVSVGQFTQAIQRLADVRAENGAEVSRLNMTNELLIQNQTNLEAAHGRIMDADVALESTRFARHNVLVQASAAMVAQANQLTNVVLTLLG